MNSLRFLAKSLVHGAIDCTGRSRRQRQRLCGKLIILTYHSFCTDWPRGLFHSLPKDRFERQIQFLKQHFNLVSLEQGLDYLKEERVDEKPWIAITIDDGFRDNYTHAWPVLQKHGVSATIFLATDFLDTGQAPWPTQLVEIFERSKARVMVFPFQSDLKNIANRSAAARTLKEMLRPLSPDERFSYLTQLRMHLGVDKDPQYFPLTWNQVREMRAGGICFGSHTAYHSILPAMDSTILEQELRVSKHRLEAEMQRPCVLFAYPDGKHNRISIAALETCGYQAAVTQDRGYNQNIEARFELKRIEVPFNDPLPSFRVRVSLALFKS